MAPAPKDDAATMSPQGGAARALLALLVLSAGTLAAPLDSAVNISFPSITAYFARPLEDIRWVIIGYVLTYLSLLLVFGKLGDLVGYRAVFRVGLAVAAVGFTLCSLATRFELLLLGRIIQGVGVALFLSCAPALATSLYDERHRTRVLSLYGALTAAGMAIGPLAGGVLVAKFGWTVVFWARIPLVVIALLLSGLLPARKGSGSTRELDPIGSLQLVAALCLAVLALAVPGGSVGPEGRIAMAVLALVLLAAFARRQARRAVPIIRPALFRDAGFSIMNIASVVVNFAAFVVVLIGPFFLIRIARLETGLAGFVLSLGAMGTVAGSWFAAPVIRRAGVRTTSLAGMVVSAAGLAAMAYWQPQTPIATMAVALIGHGIGLGLFLVAYTDLVTEKLPVADRGVAGSLTWVTRTIGIASGAAGLSAIHRTYEAAALAAGADASAAFMAGHKAAFVTAAGAVAAMLVLTSAVRRRSVDTLPGADK